MVMDRSHQTESRSTLDLIVNGEAPSAQSLPADFPPDLQAQSETSILVATSLAHFLCHLAEVMFPCVLLVVLKEFELKPDQGTLLALLGYVLFGAGALPVGVWADRWDPAKILGLYFGLLALTAVSVTLAPSPVWLFVTLTGLGLAISIYHPIGLAMLSLGMRRRSRAMGINGVAGNLGIAGAPLVAWFALRILGDWRWGYGLIALFAATSAGLMLWAVARGHWIFPRCRRDVFQSQVPTPPAGRRYFPLILLLVVMMLAGLNYRCLITALPTYLTGETGPAGQLAKAGLGLTSLALLAGSIGQILGGFWGDRFGARRIYFCMIGALLPLAAILSLLEGNVLAVLVAALVAVTLFAQQPVENTLLAESTSAARRSISYGWKFALTFGVGALGAQVAGIIWGETASLAGVFLLISVTAGVMLAILAIQRIYGQKANFAAGSISA